ncbi:hypothetical protein GA0115254_126848 [Streptomyces sp. Ncost-T10-10d]|nr:hypothetical protein GA0115254_126848 [Streptomyces sp. Ncost-T10-10d]
MNSKVLGASTVLALLAVVGASPAPVSSEPQPGPTRALPLGAVGLTETRSTRTLQPGVTLTRIVRGADAPPLAWTVEVAIPGGATSPDPDAPATALKDRASADELTADVRGTASTPGSRKSRLRPSPTTRVERLGGGSGSGSSTRSPPRRPSSPG